MKHIPKILLLGTGYTLSKVAKILSKDEVLVTSTSIEKVDRFRAMGFNSASVDLRVPQSVVELIKLYPQITTIVDGVPPIVLEDGNLAPEYQDSISILKNLNSELYIYLSTTGVYGVVDGSIVNEDTILNPNSIRGKARRHVEELISKIFNPSVLLRLPAIYAVDRGILEAIKTGRYKIIDDGLRYTNRIHVDDLVEVIIKCIRHPEIFKEKSNVFCITDDYPATQIELVNYICEKYELSFPERISLEGAKTSLDSNLLSNQRISNDKFKHFLNIQLKYPTFREGF